MASYFPRAPIPERSIEHSEHAVANGPELLVPPSGMPRACVTTSTSCGTKSCTTSSTRRNGMDDAKTSKKSIHQILWSRNSIKFWEKHRWWKRCIQWVELRNKCWLWGGSTWRQGLCQGDRFKHNCWWSKLLDLAHPRRAISSFLRLNWHPLLVQNVKAFLRSIYWCWEHANG